MLGVGYNDASNEVLLHDTWGYHRSGGSYTPARMVWADEYMGMDHYGVSVFQLTPIGGPPGLPATPSPSNGASGVSIDTGLSWVNGSNTEDVEVYFSSNQSDVVNNNPPALIYDGTAVSSLNSSYLSCGYSTTYYWRVVASNSNTRLDTDGDVWSFTTETTPSFNPPQNLTATVTDNDVLLDWDELPSGGGKSVLLRTIIGLLPKWHGKIEVLGVDLDTASEQQRRALERRWGVLFQQGALFSSLTVRQNVQFPMRENLEISQRLMDEMALAKLDMVGLTPVDADKYPAELSGGMTKRAALARALALDPEIVFLDEPTSGLDPIAAGDFDALIKTLQGTLGLTVYMNTHDLESLYTVCDRIAALADGRIVALGPMETMLECTHPWVQTYFQGKRGGMLTKRIGQLVD